MRYVDFSLQGLVRDAYQVELYQIDAPEWFDGRCYDVAAKLPEGASQDRIPAMLRTLLAERFQLKIHKETRQDRVYALVTARNGPALKPSKDQGGGPPGFEGHADGRLDFTSATCDSFAKSMSVLLARPVLNMTGIQGHFDISLNVVRGDLAGMNLSSDGASPDRSPENNASSSVFAAIRELGLRLESRTVGIQHIVVDSAQKTPVGN